MTNSEIRNLLFDIDANLALEDYSTLLIGKARLLNTYNKKAKQWPEAVCRVRSK